MNYFSGCLGLELDLCFLYTTIGAHEEQMNAALNYIDENYESFDDYRRTALGISDEQAQQLKDLLLE